MKKLFAISVFAFFYLVFPSSSYAIEDPLAVPNNKFGIHIVETADLNDAAKLVNSSGGDWGYVTLVIQKGERDVARWQKVFDEMRRLHLIPIVRIATQQKDGGWEKPSQDEINGWASFFESLNWVIKNRYIIIGNEPNHALEWGGGLNPKEYAIYLKSMSQALKRASEDFFILPAGFDASAKPPTRRGRLAPQVMDEEVYLRNMIQAEPKIFDYIDGWSSHSYPNPGFSGEADAKGRGTVRTYEWEIGLLRRLGVEKKLPIFITETGWSHNADDAKSNLLSSTEVGKRYKKAFSDAWNDPNIVAVTPFILNYQDKPFDTFSWKKRGENGYYEFYTSVQEISKNKGEPVQFTRGEIVSIITPKILFSNSQFYGLALIENTGQSIWGQRNEVIKEEGQNLKISQANLPPIEPFKRGIVSFSGITLGEGGDSKGSLVLAIGENTFSDIKTFSVRTLKIPNISELFTKVVKSFNKSR